MIPHVFSRELASICMNDYAFEVLAMIDALEVTSPKPSVDNARARKVAEEAGKARVGGSDAHAAEHLGRGLTTCPEPTLEGLLKAIRGAGTDGLVRKRG